MDAATAWDDARRNIIDLATRPGAADTHCPACPDWDVKGVVSHLTGIAKGVTGNATVEDVNSDGATADQVQLRANLPVEEVVAEWDTYVEDYLARLRDPQAFGLENISVLLSVFDITAHEHDIRAALGAPGNRDSYGVELGTKVMVSGLKGRQAQHDLPALRVDVPGWRTYDLGGDAPELTLVTDQYSLFRSLSGRRTRAQAAAMGWSGDSSPWLEHWVSGVFTWSEVEHDN